MSAPSRVLALLAGVVLLAGPFDSHAISRRDQAAVEALQARMQAAETRYREALVMIGNADPAGRGEADAALEDMEDVVSACIEQDGCPVLGLLTTYERLLKANADAGAELPGDYEIHDPAEAMAAAGAAPEATVAAELLDDDGHAFDRMVRYNPAIQEAIRRWLTDLRDELITSYVNYQYLRPQMWPQYKRARLPEALLFGLLAKESHGRVHSTSRAGAAGPLQFMYATGRRFGLGDDGTGFDTRYDPFAAAEASVAYFAERRRELGPSIELALAAYNGGEGRARRIRQANPGKSFWDPAVYSQFPPETRDYVPMVIAAAWLFLHPEQYGLDFPEVDPRAERITLQQPATIYQLTICMGNRDVYPGYMRALRNLNPRYRADDVLPAGTALEASVDMARLYRRHCLEGSRAELARRLAGPGPQSVVGGGK
jgi:membrane-bound lytic murein transglycosylase D